MVFGIIRIERVPDRVADLAFGKCRARREVQRRLHPWRASGLDRRAPYGPVGATPVAILIQETASHVTRLGAPLPSIAEVGLFLVSVIARLLDFPLFAVLFIRGGRRSTASSRRGRTQPARAVLAPRGDHVRDWRRVSTRFLARRFCRRSVVPSGRDWLEVAENRRGLWGQTRLGAICVFAGIGNFLRSGFLVGRQRQACILWRRRGTEPQLLGGRLPGCVGRRDRRALSVRAQRLVALPQQAARHIQLDLQRLQRLE